MFLLRGLAKVRGEWSLLYLTHNMLKCYAPTDRRRLSAVARRGHVSARRLAKADLIKLHNFIDLLAICPRGRAPQVEDEDRPSG